MTDENDKKPKDPGLYRESPPDAPPPPPLTPTEYGKHLQAEAEMRQFQQQVHSPMSPVAGRKVAVAAAGGIGCFAVIMWLLAIAGMAVMVLVGLVIFSCSH
jgi:hypothetical protein